MGRIGMKEYVKSSTHSDPFHQGYASISLFLCSMVGKGITRFPLQKEFYNRRKTLPPHAKDYRKHL
jgi:hypothetical protein